LQRRTSYSSIKKATNSKNKGKISKLFAIKQEHLGKIYKSGAHQTDDVTAGGPSQGADCELGLASQ